MMLGEESTSADYWKKCGDDALAHGIKGVVMMVSLISLFLEGNILMIAGSTLGCQRRQDHGISQP